MPTTRRSTARTVPTKGQSTLSFQGRVTKNVPKDVKDKIVEPAVTDIPKATLKEETATEDVKEEAAPAAKDVEEDKLETEEAEEEEEKPEVEAAPEKSESELKAEKITNTQVEKYWKAIEKQRIAPRVHQQDLDINEKVLRYFDVSSHYGVSIPW
jgi:DNA polymerase delta subunit 4